ncbi:MAG: PQQ-binding-like beta-propeller repeat protein [Deltaproteobacteria bacterium]|nr:PQQ-binding-like beta-propeller repeat protein [Deltaproteobacteria bacterium]
MPLAVIALISACSPGYNPAGFHVDFPSNQGDSLRAIAAAVAERPATLSTATLVLTNAAPARGFTVYDLPTGRQRFHVEEPIDARPIVTGGLVISHVNREVVAWDAESGAVRWRLNDHGHMLIGAGGDSQAIAISMGPGGVSRRVGFFAVVDAQTGRILLSREVQHSLGSPSVAGGYAFLPWDGQHLSVFDIARNVEHSRLLSSDDVFATVTVDNGAVYYGSRNIYRLGAESASGRRDPATSLTRPRQDLPGDPVLQRDGYDVATVGLNARERVRLLARPDPSRPNVSPTDGIVYALFHRVIFALDAQSGAVRWGHTLTGDIAGASAVRGGLVTLGDEGVLTMLDASDGHVRSAQRIEQRSPQAVLSLPLDFSPPAEGAEPPSSAADSLRVAAGGNDARMLPARIFAVNAMAQIPGADATRGLLEVASRDSYQPSLREAAGEALSHRTDGIELLIAALDDHYDWVRGTAAPPAGYIAQAIANARATAGIAPLVRHLHAHETSYADLPRITASLRALNDPTATTPLLDFLRLYHADDGLVPAIDGGESINDRSMGEHDLLLGALEQCVLAVIESGTPTQKEWLDVLVDDPNTLPPLRNAILRARQPSAGTTANSQANGAVGAIPDDPNMPPIQLGMRRISAAMAPTQPQMQACLTGLQSIPAQVRVTFWFDAEGHISRPVVTPTNLQRCIAPLVEAVQLPRSQTPRDIGTYYVVGGVR